MRFSVFEPAGSGIEAGIAVIQMTVIQRLREGPAFSDGQLVKRGSLEIRRIPYPKELTAASTESWSGIILSKPLMTNTSMTPVCREHAAMSEP